MSFSAAYPELIANPTPLMRRFMSLLDESVSLETLARKSQQVTRQNFGKTMRLFAPLYVSNECVNNCSYCGFSRDAGILRTTLTVDQVLTEARYLHDQGFRNLLLVFLDIELSLAIKRLPPLGREEQSPQSFLRKGRSAWRAGQY